MVPPLRAALALHCPVTGAVALHLLLRAVEADPGVAPALAPKLPVLLPRESPPPPHIPPPSPSGRRRCRRRRPPVNLAGTDAATPTPSPGAMMAWWQSRTAVMNWYHGRGEEVDLGYNSRRRVRPAELCARLLEAFAAAGGPATYRRIQARVPRFSLDPKVRAASASAARP